MDAQPRRPWPFLVTPRHQESLDWPTVADLAHKHGGKPLPASFDRCTVALPWVFPSASAKSAFLRELAA